MVGTKPKAGTNLKTVLFNDAEDAQESLTAAEVVVPDGRVVLLSGCVQNVNLNFLTIKDNLKWNNNDLSYLVMGTLLNDTTKF